MWLRTMLLAFVLNGLAPFGLRILAGRGLAGTETTRYLFFWYLAGLVLAAGWVLARKEKITASAAGIGSAMGLASVSGHACMGMALAKGAPGNVVFPIAVGANIFLVVAGGMLFFKERVGLYGKLGIAVGLFTAALLSLPD